ncbi:Flagellar P-ring protein precursor [Planctomycetes bacterium Poly30]|uniref:Flagellar P-ring protein n=1 Tax=Saltatorellus ferox TaxID=2528018 RepID=A0A518F0X9_9BACT|nr:Flagellar P-ring protein precursor [Planctomycetes bacterium Poly30]
MLLSTLCIGAALSVSTALAPTQSSRGTDPTNRAYRSDALIAAQQAAEARVREQALREVRKRQAAATVTGQPTAATELAGRAGLLPTSSAGQPAQASQDPAGGFSAQPVVSQVPAIEAPTQPRGVSTATFRRTPRVQTSRRGGTDFESRVASPIRSLVGVRGMEENVIEGIGLVTGLDGTGDSGALATQLLGNTLLSKNINIDPALLSTSNVAVVRVEATIPPGTKPGQKVNVRVSALGDAESLYGGQLSIAELTDVTGQTVYATASGPVTTGGLTANGNGATVKKNHNTVGTLAMGGTVQREIPTSVVSEHGYIYLDAKDGQASLGNTVRIAEAINRLYPDTARVLPDGRSVRLAVLEGIPEHQVVAYLDQALSLEIETDNLARIVINERTGVIVMGGEVRLRPGVIHHGTIVVTVAETPEISQPGPLSNGQTAEVPRTTLNLEEEQAAMVLLGGASSLEEVVEVLNVLGATPRDMVAILEAMLDGGLLIAELRRI